MMRDLFNDLARYVEGQLQSGEGYLANFYAESSDFCRLNHAKIRQSGWVYQAAFDLRLFKGRKHASSSVTLSGDKKQDRERLSVALSKLRSMFDFLPDDPFFLIPSDVNSSEVCSENRLVSCSEMVEAVMNQAGDLDLVGIICAGGIFRGFANSHGQRNWFESYSFNFDWSLYLSADNASKHSYAGDIWDASKFAQKLSAGRENLEVLRRKPKSIDPGRYRTYFAPAAMGEIFELLAWGGFSAKNLQTKGSPLIKMYDEGGLIGKGVNISEDLSIGVAPNFNAMGFIKPEKVALVEAGKLTNSLVSARTAKEYRMETNGADASEQPTSVAIDGGGLDEKRVLEELGTGLYVNHLWYLNYSHRQACRITGMTRFATFWVEDGEVVAPVSVMRFDDTFYQMFGDNLLELTRGRELNLCSSTYFQRSTDCALLPGALISSVSFTL